MKKSTISMTILALVLSALAFTTPAQDEENAKDLYLVHARNPQKGKPGMKVRVKLKRRGKEQWVPSDFAFRSGDQVKFFFEANFSAYVAAINLGTTGKLIPLFPYEGAKDLLEKGTPYELPQGDLWIRFDENPGDEKVAFIFSSQPFHGNSPSAQEPSPRPQQGGNVTVIVNQSSSPGGGTQQQALIDLNSRALENGKDLGLYQDTSSQEGYVVVSQDMVKKPRRFLVTLRHK